ncbi:MAG: DUF342 domain-containing protein [Phycisphaerae bacterium]|nr:DUF342 domain-containing protein [Phycisphaerae bacterium]
MTQEAGLLQLVVSPDNLRAWGRLHRDGNPETIAEGSIIKLLVDQGIELTDQARDHIAALVERVKRGDMPEDDVLLVEGLPPKAGEDGWIEWAPECDPQRTQPAEGVDEVDHYARSDIVSVSAESLVCTIHPPTPGEPGRDIYGREVPPHRGRRPPITFGESISHDEGDPNRLFARISGRLNVMGPRVWITPLLVVNRNVDFACGNIDFDGDVMVRGNVLDLFTVKATRGIVVRGLIEAAQVEAGLTLVAAGGIAGKEKAVIRSGGTVKARFADNATVEAASDVYLQREIVNSKVVTSGRLITPGTITGCVVEACQGVRASVVGSRSGIRTTLVIGCDKQAQSKLFRLEQELSSAEDSVAQNRAKLEPLLKRKDDLTDLSRSRLVKLLNQVKQQTADIEEMQRTRQQLKEHLRKNRDASIRITQLVREGTTIQIGRATITLRESLRGPLTLMCQRIDGVEKIVATSEGGSLIVLDSCVVG